MVDYSAALPQLQQFQTPNRLAMAQQAGTLQVQQAQLAKAQQEMDAQNKLRSLDRNSPEFVNQLYALDPAKGQAFEKGQFDMAEAKRRRGEASTVARAESHAKALDNAYAPFTRLVNNVQSPNDAAAFVTALYSHPVLGAEAVKIKPVDQAIQDSQREFAADPDKWRLLHGNLDGKTIYQISQAATAPKIEKIDLGGAVKFIDMNPKSATFKQEMGDFTKTPVPRAAAPEQTSGVAEPQVNNLAPAPTTSAFNAQAPGPVQLAMLGGVGSSPLLQMARPMPSDGGVTAPTRVAARTRRPTADEDGETPGAPINVGKVPDNYRRTASGGFEIIPGSPADPEVIKAKQEATTMGTKTAEARVKAQTSLPQVIDNAKVLEDGIAGLIGGSIIDAKGNVKYDKKAPPHPGFESAVGASLAKALPEWAVPYEGTDRAGFVERFKQVKSGAFMDAYNTLRGGGAITDKEGEKGTAALNRMSLATNEKEFIQAANEFRSIVQRGVQRAREQAGQSGAAPRPQTSGFTVVTPDNRTHTFPSQEALDNFKRAAGL